MYPPIVMWSGSSGAQPASISCSTRPRCTGSRSRASIASRPPSLAHAGTSVESGFAATRYTIDVRRHVLARGPSPGRCARPRPSSAPQFRLPHVLRCQSPPGRSHGDRCESPRRPPRGHRVPLGAEVSGVEAVVATGSLGEGDELVGGRISADRIGRDEPTPKAPCASRSRPRPASAGAEIRSGLGVSSAEDERTDRLGPDEGGDGIDGRSR